MLVGLGPLLVRRAALKGPNRDLRKPPVPPTRHLGTFRQRWDICPHWFIHSQGTAQALSSKQIRPCTASEA